MNFEMVSNKVTASRQVIVEHLDQKMDEIKTDYLAELKNDYNEEQDGYESFEDFLDENANEYVDFAFALYLLRLIPQLSEVTEAELESLIPEEKDNLLSEFVMYFKEKSGLGYSDPEPMFED